MRWLCKKTGKTTRPSQCGDTLVEVTIAMAVLGLVLAATMTIINRSLLSVMNAVERTSARGEVNSQVEMLRYVFDTQSGVNKTVAQQIIDSTGTADVSDNGCSAGSGAFYLTQRTINKDDITPIQRNVYTANDMVANTVAGAPHAMTTVGFGSRAPNTRLRLVACLAISTFLSERVGAPTPQMRLGRVD